MIFIKDLCIIEKWHDYDYLVSTGFETDIYYYNVKEDNWCKIIGWKKYIDNETSLTLTTESSGYKRQFNNDEKVKIRICIADDRNMNVNRGKDKDKRIYAEIVEFDVLIRSSELIIEQDDIWHERIKMKINNKTNINNETL